MSTVAYTTVRHGKEDGSVVVVEEGESTKDLPADVVKDLVKQKLAGDPPRTQEERDAEKAELAEENDELQAKVAELEKQLAEAKKTPPAPQK